MIGRVYSYYSSSTNKQNEEKNMIFHSHFHCERVYLRIDLKECEGVES